MKNHILKFWIVLGFAFGAYMMLSGGFSGRTGSEIAIGVGIAVLTALFLFDRYKGASK